MNSPSDRLSEEEVADKPSETTLLRPRIKKGPSVILSDVRTGGREKDRVSLDSSLSRDGENGRSAAGSPDAMGFGGVEIRREGGGKVSRGCRFRGRRVVQKQEMVTNKILLCMQRPQSKKGVNHNHVGSF